MASQRRLKELKERLKSLQEENNQLAETTGEEENSELRQRLAQNEEEVTSLQAEICKIQGKLSAMDDTSETHEALEEDAGNHHPRKSSRGKKQTQKKEQLDKEEFIKHTKQFERRYQELKTALRSARTAAKDAIEEAEILEHISTIELALDKLHMSFRDIKAKGTPDREIILKIDAASAMTDDMTQVLQQFLMRDDISETGRKFLLQLPLKKDYAKSVYGSSVSRVSRWTRSNSEVQLDLERQRTEAELAARKEELSMSEEINKQRMKLDNLEKTREIKALEARVRVLGSGSDHHSIEPPTSLPDHTPAITSNLRPTAKSFEPGSHKVKVTNDAPSMAISNKSDQIMLQAITDSIQSAHLPVPIPPTFKGDPLQYTDFKRAFTDMVEDRNIPPRRKLYYLKQYIDGPAKAAIAGCFYGSSEEAYNKAWTTLDKRYGHPFIIQEALGRRLETWPRVGPKDAKGLQAYADFLNTCLDAMPYVEGLSYLNDYNLNKRLKTKLPDWCASRWARHVAMQQQGSSRFPSFAEFVTFIQKEAEVVNHPLSAPSLSDRETEKPRRTALATTSSQENTPKPSSNKSKRTDLATTSDQNTPTSKPTLRPCCMCESTEHRIWGCPTFKEKSVDERSKIISNNRLCFRCFRGGHSSKDCQNTGRCRICKNRHHTLLHRDEVHAETKLTEGDEESKMVEPEKDAISCKTNTNSNNISTSMVLPVWVSTGDMKEGEVLTYALLDTQSDCSYITEDLAARLNLPHHEVKMKLSTLTSTSSVTCKKYHDIKLRGWNNTELVCLKSCYSRNFIPHDRNHIPSRAITHKLPHLKEIGQVLPPLQDCDAGLLIGYNCPRALAPRETVTGDSDEPFAVRTDLGWSIVGGSSTEDEHHCHRVMAKEVPFPTPKDALRILEQDFNENETDGKCHSQEDIRFLHCLEESTYINDQGHLTMPLPFKAKPCLPNNIQYAKSRLDHLKKKLVRDDKYREHYTTFMHEMIEKGYAEKVPSESLQANANFIPHHGVYHPKKPDKIRVVFDGSAKYKGTSLNEQLLKGPDLNNSIVGVLIRFREEKIAVVCDIEKMFYQFHVKQEDRDWLRFLWWENGELTSPPSEYRMKVHLFGAASSPGCANYGLKFLANKFKDKFPNAAQFLSRGFYVDDGLKSVGTTEEAIELIKQSTELCKHGGIRLHKFLSNKKEVLQCVPPSERATSVSSLNLELDSLPTERTLGINWNVAKDAFNFKVVLRERPTTRRGILATVASIYDPLGFVAPVVLPGKQILQELCRNGSQWDDLLPESLQIRWVQWKTQLQELEQLSIPRHYKPHTFTNVTRVELHHFSDASQSGYGQCSYLRFISSESNVYCTLIMAKSRVTPTKLTTIPRLELAAAVTSVKISTLVVGELDIQIDEEVFWTDSKVVLGYLANDARRFHTFVGNRVQYIRERTSNEQWRYVPTKENPADMASRGTSVQELLSSCWLNGPSFLWETDLPQSKPDHALTLGDPEVRANVLSTKSKPVESDILETLAKRSKWKSMVKLVATLRRWKSPGKSVLVEDQEAERLILHQLQTHHFPHEMKQVHNNCLPVSSHISCLNPFLDETGILRVGGRLMKAGLPRDLTSPAILPRDAHITKSIIMHVHECTNHQGRGQTLNELRSRGYWIVSGSQAVAKVIKDCITCRKVRRPMEDQKMADLPKERVVPSPPFTHTGMDVFGPFLIKRARSFVKRYGLLFTCFCSRAVHVELLDDLSTDSFMNSLRCFLALRGAVKTLHCDQGTNFVGAKNEIQEALKELEVKKLERHLAEKQCEFKFNVPHASHAGGVWERQIRSIRAILNDTIAMCPNRLDDSSLRTLFYEASYIINSRPLSPINLNDPTSQPPVTPNHLLHYKADMVMAPPGRFVKEDLYGRKRWRRVQYLLEQFWSRWRKEYLSSLQVRAKWNSPRRNLKINDIVLLNDPGTPRTEWPMGLIIKANQDEDGLVRKITVRVGTKELNQAGKPQRKISELDRPVQKVVLLVESD